MSTTDAAIQAALAKWRQAHSDVIAAAKALADAEERRNIAANERYGLTEDAIRALFAGRRELRVSSSGVLVRHSVTVNVRLYDRGWVATHDDTVIGPIPEWDDFGRELVALVDSLTPQQEPSP